MSYVATNLGLLPGGTSSTANSVRITGSSIVGEAVDSGGANQAVYWDAANTIHLLGPLSLLSAYNAANDIDVNGNIFGASLSGGGAVLPALWSAPSHTVSSLQLPPGTTAAQVLACTSDGSVAVGVAGGQGISPPESIVDVQPAIWTGFFGALLPLPIGYTRGEAIDISPDGTVIVGLAFQVAGVNQFPQVPVRWTGGHPWVVSVLDTVPGGILPANPNFNAAVGATISGNTLAGWVADSGNHSFAASWTGLSLALSTFAGPVGGSGSFVIGIDPTGAFVCGISAGGAAAVWIAGTGSLLAPFAGAISVDAANTFSSDASEIVGSGTDALARPTAVKWVWSGAPVPIPGGVGPPTTMAAAILNMANVVVTSLATESPCTVAQYVTPPGVSPAVGLRWSDTRGQTFGNAVAQALGTDPLTQLQWNRTGYARDRVFELFWSAAAKTALNGAFVDVVPWKS